jgi:glycosyltransferase involved in cell wall biosynthesis
MKITYCIPCKNNLRYLKGAIKSIEENSSVDYEIILYIDASTDGTMEWLTAWTKAPEYLWNDTGEPLGIAHGYNQCIKEARSDVVCMFHADMVMGKGFDVNLLKHLKQKTVVCATRIEPPLHQKGKEKIVEHFGMYPEDFKKDAFNAYVQNLVVKNKDVTTRGIFAPWLAYKSDLMEIGLHDESLHSYYEDSDIFQRLILNGCSMVQAWDALVYHFTCRGGQFADGVEKPTTDQQFIDMRNRSAQLYMKKWGTWIKNDEYQHPILTPKYDIGFVVKEPGNRRFILHLKNFGEVYLKDEVPNHDVVITFSEKDFMSNPDENSNFINNINAIIADSVTPNSVMECGIFKLVAKDLKDVSKDLIKL